METSITIIMADDKELWRSRLIQDLAYFQITCLGEAGNGQELLEQLETKKPDVVLLDLRMPVMDGNHTMRVLQERHPGIKVIILSTHDEEELIEDYIARGARGYIAKDRTNIEMLVNVITQVAASDTYVYRPAAIPKKYTARQLEVIPLLCEGLTNKEIAREIGITEWGVEKQKQKIYAKTGAKKAVDFYKHAFLQGLDFLSRPGSKDE